MLEVSASKTVHWMSPRDLEVFMPSDMVRIESASAWGTHVATADGAVHSLGSDDLERLSGDDVRALITISGGDSVKSLPRLRGFSE